MEPSCPLRTTRCIPLAKFHQKPYMYNKSFIEQVCSVKMAGYWRCSFSCDFMDLGFVSVHIKNAKKIGQYPPILTEQAWSYVLPPQNKTKQEQELIQNSRISDTISTRPQQKPSEFAESCRSYRPLMKSLAGKKDS